MSRFWFAYDTVGNPFAISSYRRQISTPGCLNGPVICAIYSPGGLDYPAPLSHNLKRYIAAGLANNIAEPATPPGSKFYVYLKGLAQ
jgi:hypothetical protein